MRCVFVCDAPVYSGLSLQHSEVSVAVRVTLKGEWGMGLGGGAGGVIHVYSTQGAL